MSVRGIETRSRRTYLVDSPALDSERVLIDGDDLTVLQDRLELGPDRSQIDGHHQRGRHDGPQRHLGLGLLVAQAEVADDQLQWRV